MEEGTLGSTDSRIPMCVGKLIDELHDGKSSLAESWTERHITDWVSKLCAYSDGVEITHFGYGRQ